MITITYRTVRTAGEAENPKNDITITVTEDYFVDMSDKIPAFVRNMDIKIKHAIASQIVYDDMQSTYRTTTIPHYRIIDIDFG